MLSELVAVADRLREEGRLSPTGMKQKVVNWIIEFGQDATVAIKGPYRRKDARAVWAPDRQRSGQVSEDNLKPYLLVDNGRYALGIRQAGQVDRDDIGHRAYVRLLEEAYEHTADPDLARILGFLSRPLPNEIASKVGPEDLVTFQTSSGEFPCERPAVQQFWDQHLKREHSAEVAAECAVCGKHDRIVRILPREVVVMGQKCQVTSFNPSAFSSFGKKQTTNAPLCYECAASAIDALDCLIRDPQHSQPIARDETKGQSKNPLRNQLAVFWLRAAQPVQAEGRSYDLEALLSTMLGEDAPPPQPGAPPATLAQLEEALRSPWTGRDSATTMSRNAFYLAVLSANKGRLVVREWIVVSLDELIRHLDSFLSAVRIVGPSGEPPTAQPIGPLLAALKNPDPNLTRGLLRTAYLGYPPPQELTAAAVARFRIPDRTAKNRREEEQRDKQRHAMAAVLKLVLTYGKEEAKRMEQLDRDRQERAYLCGRLLAILEEAQQRAANWRLNATIVDRFYGAASTAPAATFGTLLELAQTAHLPKLRKERLGYSRIEELLEEICHKLDEAGGFPQTLSLPAQAEFALGFYSQRADFAAQRKQRETVPPEGQETGGTA